MSEIIHCRCGRAMECARTDVLESIICPACGEELMLDLSVNGERRRGFLTVISGPERRGEQLLMPVGSALPIGSSMSNWLYLPEGGVAECHCMLTLAPAGTLAVSATSADDAPAKVFASLKPNQS